MNKGVLANGERGPAQKAMTADENLLVDIWVHLKPSLDCSLEVLCMLLGNPELCLRPSPLSMDKHFKTTCSYLRTHVTACIETRDFTLIIADTKHKDLVTIILTTWNISRKSATLYEVASLLGLVSNLALTTQWVKHTHTHISLKDAVSIALKFNSNVVFSSGKHKHLTDLFWYMHTNIKKCLLSKAHKTVWN